MCDLYKSMKLLQAYDTKCGNLGYEYTCSNPTFCIYFLHVIIVNYMCEGHQMKQESPIVRLAKSGRDAPGHAYIGWHCLCAATS